VWSKTEVRLAVSNHMVEDENSSLFRNCTLPPICCIVIDSPSAVARMDKLFSEAAATKSGVRRLDRPIQRCARKRLAYGLKRNGLTLSVAAAARGASCLASVSPWPMFGASIRR
jgi:hypothetical protein